MKKIFCYLTVLFISLVAFNGCRKMDSKYEKYIVPGGEKYSGKANYPRAYAGRNRVQITWQRGADPNITKAKIYWNNYADSLEVNVPLLADSVVVIIDSLLEKNYSFFIRNYDAKGISSVPVEIIGASYGDRYQSQILNRALNTSFIDVPGQISIQWGAADISNGAFANEVKYTDATGALRIKRFNIDVKEKKPESKILDYMPGTTFQYRTLFIPKSLAVDTFYTDFTERKYFNIKSTALWSVIAVSTQVNTTTWAGKNFFDGLNTTGWHAATTSHYPHFITIDMKKPTVVAGFQVIRYNLDERGCNTFSFSVSLDNITWTNLGVFNFNRMSQDVQTYFVPSHPSARYFKFTGLTGPLEYQLLGDIKVLEL